MAPRADTHRARLYWRRRSPTSRSAAPSEWTRSAFLGNLHVTALALYAEAAAARGYEAFRV